MSSEAAERTRSLLRWMREEHLRGLDVGPMLRDQRLEELRESFRQHPELSTFGVFRYLLNAAHEELDRNPKRPLTITTVLMEYLGQAEASAPEVARVPMLILRATAHKEYANALRVNGKMPEAVRAVNDAIELLATDPLFEYELATVKMLAAHLRQEQGDVDTALSLLASSREVFDRLGERGQAARAKTFEAAFLFERDRQAAKSLWLGAIDDAAAINDHETVARITQNLGVVAALQGNEEEANQYFDRAYRLFGERGMTAERTRVRWGRAALLRTLGKLGPALEELQRARTELESDGRALQAAQASLEIIELLLALDKDNSVQQELADLSTTFARAGMPEQTARALAYLREANPVTREHVVAVREFLGVLEANPEAAFVAAS